MSATGPLDAMTDVAGIAVGHATVREEGRFNTGVTAIVPDRLPTPAGLFVGNGYGKLIGATQLLELGEIETPILLTGTLSAFRVADAVVTWMLEQPNHASTTSINPIVGETNDGYLSDIRARPIRDEDVFAALRSAHTGSIEQGCVGAGAGTSALGFKGGIGTSSRTVHLDTGGAASASPATFTVGALVQTNFGGTLVMDGRTWPAEVDPAPEFGSCMIVVATDAPLVARQLGRVARRAVFAMARVGANFSHGSGDYAIAVATRQDGSVADDALSPLFAATMDAVESALVSSLMHAVTTRGPGGRFRRSLLDTYPELRPAD